jgi:hypothetical protein
MAGLLDTIYLVVATLVAVGGLLVVASVMNDVDPDGTSLLDWSLMVVAAVFLLGLAASFVT